MNLSSTSSITTSYNKSLLYGNSSYTTGVSNLSTSNEIIGPGSFINSNMIDFTNRPSSVSFMANTIN